MRGKGIIFGLIAVAVLAVGSGSWVLAAAGYLRAGSPSTATVATGTPSVKLSPTDLPSPPSQTPAATATAIPPSPTPEEPPSPTPSPTSTPSPTPALTPARESALLQPMVHEYQKLNNCGPIATEMVLSYYGIVKSQFEVAAAIRPHMDDKAVFPQDIIRYVRQYNLAGVVRVNGSADLLKSLVSNGIPVITETLLKPDDDIGHYRVVRGYDDQEGVFILGDPYYGAEVRMTYAEFDQVWRAYNRRYIPIYQPESELVVRQILGDDYDEQANFRGALAVAQNVAAANPGDVQTLLNVGESYFGLEEYRQATAVWEQARALGVPFRTLWYISWPATAYNKLGEYDKVIALTNEVFAQSPVAPELLYEQGVAYLGLGNRERAKELFQLALSYDPNVDRAQEELDSLQ